MESAYIDRVLSGDIDAFNYFINTYKNMAFALAISMVKDEQYAEEVVQDAFLKAFHGLKKFKRTAKFKSWFYRIVVNESLLKLRSLKKNQELVNFDDNLSADILDEPFEDAIHHQSEKIHRVLALLPPKESLVLELFYSQGLSINDIVEVTGWSKSNTKVILHRARIHVRQLWKNEDKNGK